jgi:pimeloyl-ACP methyl ester carboxylesterase
MSTVRNGVRLAHEDAGAGEPACILIHGWGTDRTSLAHQHAFLSATRRVVSVDLRGFGESSSPPQKYTIDRYADDVAYVATKLGLEKFVVVGHSLGGLIALELAASHAERVIGLVVLESFLVPSAQTRLALRGTFESLCQENGDELGVRLVAHLLGAGVDPAERERMLAVLGACPRHVLLSAFEGLLAFESAVAASQVKCPFLYVGTSHRYADEVELKRLCPQLVIERLDGKGHFFPIEAAEELNALIARFLEQARWHEV